MSNETVIQDDRPAAWDRVFEVALSARLAAVLLTKEGVHRAAEDARHIADIALQVRDECRPKPRVRVKGPVPLPEEPQ